MLRKKKYRRLSFKNMNRIEAAFGLDSIICTSTQRNELLRLVQKNVMSKTQPKSEHFSQGSCFEFHIYSFN